MTLNVNDHDEIIDQYVAFDTNMKITNKSKLIKTIPETYCKRWIIETRYSDKKHDFKDLVTPCRLDYC